MLDALLFVDDDVDLRDAMTEVIANLGVQRVIAAGSLRDVQEQRDDALACQLALLDINLGSGEPSGISVFEWLESEGFTGRVVFLTGHGNRDPRVQHAASVSGANVTSKPLTIAQLRTLIGGASAPS